VDTAKGDYELIHVENDGPLTVITINRPEARNSLNFAAHCELDRAFDAFAADDSQWVAIITGAGDKAFCAGQDLKQSFSGEGIPFPKSGFGGLTSRRGCNKPIIAAVNGVAMGGGFEIALACDLVVAHEAAMFALPEVRVGLAAVAGGLHRLPREIGRQRAMGMLLTGRRVSAREGQAMGFVNEVVADDVLGAAKALAAEILACSPMSIRATKEAVNLGLEVSLEEAMRAQLDYPALQQMFKSEDAVEGPAAFAAKRVPNWKGR
jgi:crotonobetainyl-CoA hydratase